MRAAVQELPAKSGIELANWNWKVVRQFVLEGLGISLSRSSCLNYLHRLGFVLKRPKKRLVKADEGSGSPSWRSTPPGGPSTQSNPYCQLFSIEGRDAIFGDEAVLCEVWHSWFRRNMVCGWRHRKKGGSGG